MFTGFYTIHERDGRTDGQTLHDGKGRACSLARLLTRGKKLASIAYIFK